MSRFQRQLHRLRNLLLVLVVLSWQVAFAGAPFIHPQTAHAAPTCVTDTAGPNDVPGQKDLTQLCIDYAGLPTSVATTWNWDETGTNGANTMDACNLFDTDGNGNADYAVCVTTTGDPATKQGLTTYYSCGDARADRCTSPTPAISTGTTDCTVTQVTNDPFPTGDSSPKDTQGACTIQLSSIGGASATLIDVCSYPSSQPNSDPSDCVIAQPRAGELEVKKHLIPNTNSGLFNLQVNSVTKAANVGDGGTTGKIVEPAGNNGTSYTVGETAGTATSLSSYNSSIECRDLNGTGSVVASGSTTSTSVTVNDGVSIVCVITNTLKQATLILQKTVTNDNGGTLTQSNFPVAIGATTAQWGSNSVSPGTYTVSETQQTGYQAGAWGTDCTAGGSVTLTPGQTKTCSITNNDIAPQLTVVKHVVNDNGGTAVASSFTMNVTGTSVSNASFAGAESPGTTVTLNAGSYSVDEGTAIGYSKTLSTDCSGTIAIGQTKTCTITNDDIAPNLTVTKVVVNPYGTPLDPSAFPLFVDSISVTSGVSTNQFNAGSHTVTETQQAGYTLTGISGNCTQSQQGTISLTLSIGGTSTCTLTNTAIQPKLTVIKHVINDNGGTKVAGDFTMSVTGTNVSSSSFAGAESPGTTVTLNAGSYSVDETSHTGYTETMNGDCDSTIAIGQTKTCTITNDDIAPSLTLNKIVSNTHGGAAVESNWTLAATGPSTLSGPGAAGNTDVVSGSTFKAGTYTLSESGSPTGYSASDWACTNGVSVANSQIILTPAQSTVCSITNSDVAPSLTVTKVVSNPYGTPLDPSAFPLFVDSISVTSGVPTTQFSAGNHTVTETQQTGYTLTGVSGDCNQSDNTISLTLSVGGTSTCTLTNSAIQPKLTIIKHVINDNGGANTAGDFTMTVSGNSATVPNFPGNEAGTMIGLNEGSYSANELAATGYTKSLSTDCSGTISIGQTKTCTITNDDVAPSLTLNKIVSNTHGGTAVESNWTLTASGPSTLSGPGAAGNTDVVSGSTFKAGTYTLSESGSPSGYSASNWTCTNDVAVTNSEISLANGQTTVCSITNSDVAPSLTVTKVVVNPYGTALDPSAFPLFVDSISVTSGVPTTQFSAGNHTVTETQQTGYSLTGVSGDCNQADNGTISLSLSVGTSSTCTLTNTAIQPKLTVIKHVINDNSGTESADDFTMTVTGNPATISNFPGSETGTTVGLSEGSYSVDEVSHVGYTETFSGDCDSSISIGQTKTCTITNNDVAHPAIHIVKSGPATAHEGDTVTYTFTVTNTGDTALSGIAVNDDVAGAGIYQSGDTNDDGILQNTETWIYTKDFVIPADQTEDVVNTAEACGHYIETKVCNTDEHTLDVLHPSIQVEKFGPATAFEGDLVAYTYTVTNTGDTELTDVGINDDLATGETCLSTTLAVDESTTCSATYTIPTPQIADVTNHVIASGTDSLDETVTATDQHTLVVLHPSIHVVKSGPSSAPAGSTVTYTFTVTNTGDIPLSGLTVQDNIAGTGVYQSGDTNNDGILQANETWIYTAQYSIPSNQFNSIVNTVTACGSFDTQGNTDEELSNILDNLDSVDGGVSQSVCAQDSHTLVIPKVLAETTPPQLVNTGQPILASIVAGSAILTILLIATGLSRRNTDS